MKFIDITGNRYNRLKVLHLSNTNTGKSKWVCLCDCGQQIIAIAGNLKNGTTKSCGCLRKEVSRQHLLKNSKKYNTTHGESGKGIVEYNTWLNIHTRTTNNKHAEYKNYGGRGISMCQRWIKGNGILTGYECFLKDMGRRPSKYHSIERVDNDGDYCPENCIWATMKEQQLNKNRVTKENREMLLKRIIKSYDSLDEFIQTFNRTIKAEDLF